MADASINQAYVATGSKSATKPDEPAVVRALVEYVNAHGGIAGRRVVPVLRSYGAAADGNTDQMMQEACQAFTEDNQVFAGFNTAFSTNSSRLLAECLARRRTVMVLHTKIAWDSQDFRALAPYVYAPGYLATDRWDPVADLLVSRGYFDRGYKLGIVSIEEPAAQRLVTRFERRLARHGIRVTDKANVGTGNGYDWVGQVGSQTSSMVLRFKTSGITHVLFLGTYTSASYFFPTYAESQGYRPRYAYTSTEMPSYTEKNEPAAQLARSVAVGWRPTLDVNPPQDPKDNANEQLCLRVVHRAGIETNDRVAENSVLGVCEFLLFLKQGLDGAPELSPAGLRARVDRLGSGFASSQTPRTLFAPGRYDGAAALRWVAFDSACTCFRYSGRWRDLS